MKRPAAAANLEPTGCSLPKQPAAARDINIAGTWIMTVTDTGDKFTYKWTHKPGSDTFKGSLIGTGPISHATLTKGELRWCIPSKTPNLMWCSARLHSDGKSLVDGAWWQEDVGTVLGEFSGQRQTDVQTDGPSQSKAIAKRPAPGIAPGTAPGRALGRNLMDAHIRKRLEKQDMAEFIVGKEKSGGESSFVTESEESCKDIEERSSAEDGDDSDDGNSGESSLDEGRVACLGGKASLKCSAAKPNKRTGANRSANDDDDIGSSLHGDRLACSRERVQKRPAAKPERAVEQRSAEDQDDASEPRFDDDQPACLGEGVLKRPATKSKQAVDSDASRLDQDRLARSRKGVLKRPAAKPNKAGGQVRSGRR